jgi:hypothetical protein
MGMKHIPNGGFVNSVLKCGRNTDKLLLHVSILVQNAGKNKPVMAAGKDKRRLP